MALDLPFACIKARKKINKKINRKLRYDFYTATTNIKVSRNFVETWMKTNSSSGNENS